MVVRCRGEDFLKFLKGMDDYSNALYMGGDESSLCLLKGGADDTHSSDNGVDPFLFFEKVDGYWMQCSRVGVRMTIHSLIVMI